jgi:hypothetical protein
VGKVTEFMGILQNEIKIWKWGVGPFVQHCITGQSEDLQFRDAQSTILNHILQEVFLTPAAEHAPGYLFPPQS